MANFQGTDDAGGVAGGKDSASGINQYVSDRFDRSLTWADVKWLVGFTKLPVIVKGVLRADDALKAIECGVKGILVSNHGARQVDTVPATVRYGGWIETYWKFILLSLLRSKFFRKLWRL